jgi:hypothetical protein
MSHEEDSSTAKLRYTPIAALKLKSCQENSYATNQTLTDYFRSAKGKFSALFLREMAENIGRGSAVSFPQQRIIISRGSETASTRVFSKKGFFFEF